MQMASSGAFGAARNALHRSVNTNAAAKRNIHIAPARNVQLSAGRRLLSQSRNLLSRFIGQLTAPGLGVPRPTSYHQAARASIQQRCSLPVRTTLTRAQLHYLPKPPAVPRSIAQVGLGTARNFSSARPVFQNLVQNVPVAARAFCEADVDLKGGKQQKKVGTKKSASGKKRQVFRVKDTKATRVAKPVVDNEAAEIEHYMPVPSAEVTTCLHIPLAPTPTSRVPLEEFPSQRPLLPVPELTSLHASHELHSLRVSSLFSRLDAANVWDKGVICSAYSHRAAGEGLATILKVEFVGWTQAEVRAVIGESGTGWCALEEITESTAPLANEAYDSDTSETSSVLSGILEDDSCSSVADLGNHTIDPSASVVLPTLDFSSSFVAAQSTASTPPVLSRTSSELSLSLSDYDYFSDSGSDRSHVLVEAPAAASRMGFSADFIRRSEAFDGVEEGPMESMF